MKVKAKFLGIVALVNFFWAFISVKYAEPGSHGLFLVAFINILVGMICGFVFIEENTGE